MSKCVKISQRFFQILIATDKVLYQNSKYQTNIKKEHNIFCSDFLYIVLISF